MGLQWGISPLAPHLSYRAEPICLGGCEFFCSPYKWGGSRYPHKLSAYRMKTLKTAWTLTQKLCSFSLDLFTKGIFENVRSLSSTPA